MPAARPLTVASLASFLSDPEAVKVFAGFWFGALGRFDSFGVDTVRVVCQSFVMPRAYTLSKLALAQRASAAKSCSKAKSLAGSRNLVTARQKLQNIIACGKSALAVSTAASVEN